MRTNANIKFAYLERQKAEIYSPLWAFGMSALLRSSSSLFPVQLFQAVVQIKFPQHTLCWGIFALLFACCSVPGEILGNVCFYFKCNLRKRLCFTKLLLNIVSFICGLFTLVQIAYYSPKLTAETDSFPQEINPVSGKIH